VGRLLVPHLVGSCLYFFFFFFFFLFYAEHKSHRMRVRNIGTQCKYDIVSKKDYPFSTKDSTRAG